MMRGKGEGMEAVRGFHPDLTNVKPYGDTYGDGMVQVSFSLPVPFGEEGREAARQLALKMGLSEPQVYHGKDLGEGFSFYILYGKLIHTVDYTSITVQKINRRRLSREEIDRFIREKIGRKVVVIGACTGTDAHTVGIDAIMNMKGYHGEYGLERYEEIEAINLGSQVPNETLIEVAREKKADALLVSQVVTQKGIHLHNLTELIDLLEAEGIRDKMLLICGGPRITHEIALELGFDAGFGLGTLAPDVGSYIVQEMVARKMERGMWEE
ncbi:OAM dimerization domain-containing protein [Thermicanus aegyptius]|uniref:lysine 5,6-aminomutase subunit beta n=1 Tax=Thermicanus aegyptius TaxID=94009 RepID=UPI000404F8E3|nr:OAM dimerization domain-containing protein [Thermicanus aegyptius]